MQKYKRGCDWKERWWHKLKTGKWKISAKLKDINLIQISTGGRKQGRRARIEQRYKWEDSIGCYSVQSGQEIDIVGDVLHQTFSAKMASDWLINIY